jgi:hypothetical protein
MININNNFIIMNFNNLRSSKIKKGTLSCCKNSLQILKTLNLSLIIQGTSKSNQAQKNSLYCRTNYFKIQILIISKRKIITKFKMKVTKTMIKIKTYKTKQLTMSKFMNWIKLESTQTITSIYMMMLDKEFKIKILKLRMKSIFKISVTNQLFLNSKNKVFIKRIAKRELY